MTVDLLHLLIAAGVGTLAVARATRLVTADSWPPVAAVREWWINLCGSRARLQGWAPLLDCPFCFAPYAAAVDLTWAVLSDLGSAWWIVNTWAAVSYVAAMVVVRDEPPEVD